MGNITKETKRNKCDLCDELAIFKTRKEYEDLYSYFCKNCYEENKKMLRRET